LDLYSRKDKSIPQKIIILVLEITILGISYWILFKGGYYNIFKQLPDVDGNDIRHLITTVLML